MNVTVKITCLGGGRGLQIRKWIQQDQMNALILEQKLTEWDFKFQEEGGLSAANVSRLAMDTHWGEWGCQCEQGQERRCSELTSP